MRPIRFEEADSPERTQIGEGLTRVAVAAGRLETGREGGKYFLRHDDGCGVCGRPIEAGDAFYLDPDAGEILCDDHGRERREAVENEGEDRSGGEGEGDSGGDGGPGADPGDGTDAASEGDADDTDHDDHDQTDTDHDRDDPAPDA